MRCRLILLSVSFLVSIFSVNAIDTMTGIFNERIKSLQVSLDGYEMAPPVIALNTNDRLIFSFDHLAEEKEYIRYELVHCNANWQPSGLVDSEFLDGFNYGDIENYDYSQMTTVHYVHYELTIPNEQVAPKVSGNYLLKIYPENDIDDVWLQCRFMVSEECASINSQVSSLTDIDINREHQQLSLVVDTEHANVPDPFNELTVMIQQNGRFDNEVALRQPMRMSGRYTSIYEHQSPLIFEAGNEYRRVETISVTYPTMGVYATEYHEPYYHSILNTDESRSEDAYVYDQTQFGKFKIREYNSSQSEIEADYTVVHFTLDVPEMPDAMIFIDGDFTNRRFDPESLMTYNRSTGLYERYMLLKQGAYNYQYLVVPNGKNRGFTGPIEGNKHQTMNEYLIKVYTRRPGDRYDRLIGVTTAYSGQF